MLPVLLDPSLDFDSVVLLFFKDLPCPLKFGIGLLNFFLETGHERFLLLKSSHGLRESLYPVFISRVDSLHFVGCRKLHAEALKLFDMGFICSTFSKLLLSLILLAERLQQVSEQMAADVQKQMEDFDKEIEAFKVMKDNLAKVDRAYFKHQNSTEYGNMAKELEDCAKAMSIGELNAAKGRLAQKAKEYLEHTGLGSASIFHKNSETRRKLAFLMLNKTDPTLYAQFEARANQLRSGSDKISAASLEGMEGVGKPLPAVRSIRVEDIAGEAPAQQERKAHNRNIGAQVKTDKKLEEPEAGLNGPNHN